MELALQSVSLGDGADDEDEDEDEEDLLVPSIAANSGRYSHLNALNHTSFLCRPSSLLTVNRNILSAKSKWIE